MREISRSYTVDDGGGSGYSVTLEKEDGMVTITEETSLVTMPTYVFFELARQYMNDINSGETL